MRRVATGAAISAAIVLSACSATGVDAPDVVRPSDLGGATGAATLFAGAYGYFGFGYSWAVEKSGTISDELKYIVNTNETADTRLLPDGARSYFAYIYLSQARVNALVAVAAYEQNAPTQRGKIAELFAVEALTEILFAEHMCSGVPLSSVSGTTVTPGPQLSTKDMLGRASTDLDSASAYAGDTAAVRYLAQVARGRVLLDLGQSASAATAVAAVPTNYVYRVTYPSSQVTVWNEIADDMMNPARNWYLIGDNEGGNGLPFVSAADPRVPTKFIKNSSVDAVPSFAFTPFVDFSTPLVVENGIEARLIEAEAALQANDVTTYLAKLNGLRQSAISPAMAPLTDPGAQTSRVDLLFRERAFWLFLTAHRQGDLRRLIRQYGRTQDKVFPTGAYQHSLLNYGAEVTFPIFSEGNNGNPNLNSTTNACLDRNA
jgi:hypothetical protein